MKRGKNSEEGKKKERRGYRKRGRNLSFFLEERKTKSKQERMTKRVEEKEKWKSARNEIRKKKERKKWREIEKRKKGRVIEKN